MRNTPNRVSPATYPIAATATAPAYEIDIDPEPAPSPVSQSAQQALFSTGMPEPRVIPFASLTTQAERESIRARAADLVRPAPPKIAKVEVRHARPRKTRSTDQRRLDFDGHEQVLTQPQSSIICDAPVAPPRLRVEAAFIDAGIIALGWAVGVVLFALKGSALVLDKHVLLFLAVALATVPLFYKLLWTFAARDTIGMRCAGLRLVDFDGNPPAHTRRYQRMAGSFLSLLAAGIGLIWMFVDEDGLTWHDHISGTFPTIDTEN
ncbi:MAG: RDD family protein [Acidobacteriaceae bacterium]|nr:RDD family protein [Acidobacteriaceae bacterium]